MKKLISFVVVIILFIPTLFISAKAELTNWEYKLIYNTHTFLSIDRGQEFNYIIVDPELAKNLYRVMPIYNVSLADDDEYVEYIMDIGHGYNIYIYYYINGNKGVGFEFIFEGEKFLTVWNNTVWSKTLDLREYNLRFKLDMAKIKSDALFNELYELVGFDFLNAVMYSEEDIVEEYSVYDAPTDTDLFNRYKYGTDQESFIVGEYKSIYPGHYKFQVGTITSTRKFYLINYDITLKEEDILVCGEYRIGYKEKLTKDAYMDNITINGNAINKYMCSLSSEYFDATRIKIGEYDVNVTYKRKNNEVYGLGKIIVIDNIKPVIYGKNSLSDYISSNRDIVEYLKSYEAIDEIDGDVSDTFEVVNLDNYNPNNKEIGNYRFILRANDKSGNISELFINYQIKNDIVPQTSENENINPSSSIPLVTSSSNVIPHTEQTTEISQEVVPSESSSVSTTIPTTEKSSEIPSVVPSVIPSTTIYSTRTIEEFSSISTSASNKEKIINDKTDNDIEFVIKTDKTKELTKKDIENKLKFYGLIADSFSGDIISDYFDSHNEVGEYLITVVDENGEHFFMIEVTSNQTSKQENAKEEDNKSKMIITFGIILGVVLLVFIVIIVVMNKKKLNN